VPGSLVRKLTLPNTAYITNNYDLMGRLTNTALLTSGQSLLDSYAYAYDIANERTNVVRMDGSYVK